MQVPIGIGSNICIPQRCLSCYLVNGLHHGPQRAQQNRKEDSKKTFFNCFLIVTLKSNQPSPKTSCFLRTSI